MKIKGKKTLLLISTLAILSLSCVTSSWASQAMVASDSPKTSLAPVLEKVIPGVVSIETEGVQIERQRIPDELRFFFGPSFPAEQFNRRPFQGKGSGVIVDANKGYVITNHHVTHEASKIRVLLNDGRKIEAKLIGHDELSDLALLQLASFRDLHAIQLADSDKLRVGDFVVAIGNPFGIGQTATSGIISALGRTGLNIDGIENFIQTDAAINAGNSGGALIDTRGEVIGINTAMLAPNGGYVGIGFAIPSNMVKSFIEQITKYGKVRRVQLGITGRNLDSELASALHLDIQQGAFVNEVMPNSSAERAGIKAGDVIIKMDDQAIRNFAELRSKIATVNTERSIKLGILRDGKLKNIIVNLQLYKPIQVEGKILHPALQGVDLKNSSAGDNKGVEISHIQKNSPAQRFGLQEGDIIVAINRESVGNVEQLQNILNSDPKPSVLALSIQRRGTFLYLIIQ